MLMADTFDEKTRKLLDIIAKRRYYILTECIGATHALFLVVFAVQRVMPMVVFNIFSPIMYFSARFFLDHKKEYAVFVGMYIEILVHAIMATWFTGWETGFQQYLIGLVPLGFMACYELTTGKTRFTIATVLGLCATFCYVICRQLSYTQTPPYVFDSRVTMMLYNLNSVATFAILFFFLIIYTYNMNEMESKLKRQNAVLDYRASVDPLTSLLNRRSMGEQLKKSLDSGRYFSVAMCDIDDFKMINDSYGHEAGDLVLKEVTRLINENIPEGNPICRWGGEEILILYNDHTSEEAVVLSERIRRAIDDNYIPFYNKTIHVTITIGVAAHSDSQSIEETIAVADGRLYYGKNHGKNQVISFPVPS